MYRGGKENATLLFLSFYFLSMMCPCRTGDVCFRHTRELHHASSDNVRAGLGRRKADVVFGKTPMQLRREMGTKASLSSLRLEKFGAEPEVDSKTTRGRQRKE